jgi:hypothetical protein
VGGHVPNHQPQLFLLRIRVVPRNCAGESAERSFADGPYLNRLWTSFTWATEFIVNNSSASLSIFAASSGEPRSVSAFKETVREGIRRLLKERKLGEPRTDSGCKEPDRSMMMGGRDTPAADAVEGRRAICIQRRIRATRVGAPEGADCYYVRGRGFFLAQSQWGGCN